jgi:hypothetical protein
MVAAGTASAAPHWLVCLPEHSGTTTTKYTEHQCVKAGAGGGWEWSELRGTEAARSHESLRLKDTKILGKTVEVKCSGEDVGSVGPGRFDRITAIENIKCVKGENCEEVTKAAEPRNLPWQTELVEEEGKIRDKIKAENGKGAGWALTCKVLSVSETDECTSEEEGTSVANTVTSGGLLVLAEFESKTAKAKCSIGGTGAGVVEGPDAILLTNGWGLRVAGGSGGGGGETQPEFKLEGRTSDEFAEEAKVKENPLLEAEGEPTIECSKIKFDDGAITNNSPEATFKSIHFEGCVDKSAEATCEVPTIETAELKDTLQEDGAKGETDEKFAPKSGDEIAHFKLKGKEGKECSETNELKLEGDFISKQEDNENPEDEHNLGIDVTPESKELEYGDRLSFASFRISFSWHLSIEANWFLFW